MAFTEAQIEAALAWLCYPQLDPVPIGLKPVISIGRHPASDLVLIHESVSRTHAVVRPAGERIVIEDRSSYGTWVNGQRTLTGGIQAGDVITIGPYDLKVEKVRPTGGDVETKPLRTFVKPICT